MQTLVFFLPKTSMTSKRTATKKQFLKNKNGFSTILHCLTGEYPSRNYHKLPIFFKHNSNNLNIRQPNNLSEFINLLLAAQPDQPVPLILEYCHIIHSFIFPYWTKNISFSLSSVRAYTLLTKMLRPAMLIWVLASFITKIGALVEKLSTYCLVKSGLVRYGFTLKYTSPPK